MPTVECGPVRFEVSHRSIGGDGGPSLQVHRKGDNRQLLRFDCFDRNPHWHSDPEGRDEIRRIEAAVDPVGWAIGELRNDLDGYLAGAGGNTNSPERGELEPALDRAEGALRNPPIDLDRVRPEQMRLRQGEKWQQYGPDVLPAWVADMDFPVAEPIQRALRRTFEVNDLGYPTNPRPDGLPTVFAERMQARFGWSIDPRRVEVMIDVVQGIFVALQTLCDEGDGVVIQPPIYPPFFDAVRETGRRLVPCPLVPDQASYTIDEDALRTAAGESRVLLLSHPHNPTGRAFRREELECLARVAVEHDLVVLSDEIHADLVYAPGRHIPLATVSPEIAERTITLTSATKAFNIAGLRCSVAHFGSAGLKRRFLAMPRHSRGGANTLGMTATRAAWQHAQPWLDSVLAYLDGNRRFVADFLGAQLPEIRYAVPEATYLAWLDCRALGLESPHRFFLNEAGVGLSDGVTFGPEGTGFVRLNFATSRAILTEILECMAKAVAEARA